MSNARILEFLGKGLNPNQVVNIVGCSPKYMKGLLEDPEFVKQIEALRLENAQEADEDEAVTVKYVSLEHKILQQIESTIGNCEIRDAIRALEVVGNRQEKRLTRKNPGNGNPLTVVNVVSLSLPAHAIPEIRIDGNRQVVAIDSKAISPMPSSNVRQLFNDIVNNEKEVKALA